MPSEARHSEAAFETVVETYLLTNGYVTTDRDSLDRERAIFPNVVLAFIRETQKKDWDKLEALHGDKTGEQILTDLCKWMDQNGSLATLRHGFKCYGRTLHIAFFKAAHDLNHELEVCYAANRLGITRQLHFSLRSEKSKNNPSDPLAPNLNPDILIGYWRLSSLQYPSLARTPNRQH